MKSYKYTNKFYNLVIFFAKYLAIQGTLYVYSNRKKIKNHVQ
jgi:hypothetical protein